MGVLCGYGWVWMGMGLGMDRRGEGDAEGMFCIVTTWLSIDGLNRRRLVMFDFSNWDSRSLFVSIGNGESHVHGFGVFVFFRCGDGGR